MPQQMYKLQISLNYGVIPEDMASEGDGVGLKVVEMNWTHLTN